MTKLKYILSRGRLLERVDSPLLKGWDVSRDWKTIDDGAVIVVDNKMEPDVDWVGKKMPAAMFQKIVGTVRKFNALEAGFVLEYNVEAGAWNVAVTEQWNVSGVHFNCDDTHQHAGFMSMGDVHTHPNMPAFFSGEDDTNGKKTRYGVHIVLGHHKGVIDTTAARIYTPTSYYDKPIWDFVEEFDLAGDYESNSDWLKTLEESVQRQTFRQQERSKKMRLRDLDGDSGAIMREPIVSAPWAMDDNMGSYGVFDDYAEERSLLALRRLDADVQEMNADLEQCMADMSDDKMMQMRLCVRAFNAAFRRCRKFKSFILVLDKFLPKLVETLHVCAVPEPSSLRVLENMLAICSYRVAQTRIRNDMSYASKGACD